MSLFLSQKRKLITEVFEKAKKNTAETSFSGILKDLEETLRDDFSIQLSYKSLVTYYKVLVEKNGDYKIKPIILDDLSKYLGETDFKSFCDKYNLDQSSSQVTVNVNGDREYHDTSKYSDIIINITNSPIFTVPEFISKHSQSFGIAGFLLVAGFLVNKTEYFKNGKENEIIKTADSKIEKPPAAKNKTDPEQLEKNNQLPSAMTLLQSQEKITVPNKKKECMYWNDEEYIPVFCDEKIADFKVEQFNNDQMKLKKITRKDTLTKENSFGKVWYDKSNNRVEFFTYHGINPKNGKTLKNVTTYILEKYAH